MVIAIEPTNQPNIHPFSHPFIYPTIRWPYFVCWHCSSLSFFGYCLTIPKQKQQQETFVLFIDMKWIFLEFIFFFRLDMFLVSHLGSSGWGWVINRFLWKIFRRHKLWTAATDRPPQEQMKNCNLFEFKDLC